MIKFSLVFSFLILFITNNVNGQSLKSLNGYEWIVPGKKYCKVKIAETGLYRINIGELTAAGLDVSNTKASGCLLYTSDAADERSSVDLGGRRIIKKKIKKNT